MRPGASGWIAASGPESSERVEGRPSLDEALELCDEWKGDLEVVSASGELTAQTERF